MIDCFLDNFSKREKKKLNQFGNLHAGSCAEQLILALEDGGKNKKNANLANVSVLCLL